MFLFLMGGPSYSGANPTTDKPDYVGSRAGARRFVYGFLHNRNGRSPCAEGCTFYAYKTDPAGNRDPYPDFTVEAGPKGGIRFNPA